MILSREDDSIPQKNTEFSGKFLINYLNEERLLLNILNKRKAEKCIY